MYSQTLTNVLVSMAALISLASAHGLIIAAEGNEGGKGFALGVDTGTPRTGTNEQDTTHFGGQQNLATATGCGATNEEGTINIATALQAVISQNNGLPQVSAGGVLNMTYHQINTDGGGPIACAIDPTGKGTSFTTMLQITANIPGKNGIQAIPGPKDQPLNVVLPKNLVCTGTSGTTTGICMVRCQNPAAAGPFGGCVPVQQANAAKASTPPAEAVFPPAKAATPTAGVAKAAVVSAKPATKTHHHHHHHPHHKKGKKMMTKTVKRSSFNLRFFRR